MPNWCSTHITINYPDDEQRLEGFRKRLEDWTSKNFCDNGFGNSWLGNIVGFSGIGDPSKESVEYCPRCRGYVSHIGDVVDGQLYIWTDTAWHPMLEMWQMLIDKYIPEAEIMFCAEEFGYELFCSNDPTQVGLYYLYIEVPNWEDETCYYDIPKDLVIEILQEICGNKDINDVDDLISKINLKKDHYVYALKCEFAEIGDFE